MLSSIMDTIKRIRGTDCVMVLATLLIIPAFYISEILFVIPVLYERWSFWYSFHFVMSLFLMHNIVGNLRRGMQGPGNIRDDLTANPSVNWRFCSTCNCMCPPRSWHCSICEICIFKRDHHCNFFGCCIGYFNYRYFYMFVMHVFIAMIYALVINVIFFVRFIDFSSFGLLTITAFFFPFASLIVEWSRENCYIVLLVVNVVFALFTGYLFIYHSLLLFRGRTAGESKHLGFETYNSGWKKNFIDAFGDNWYLVWITPFIWSQLPSDGTYWKSVQD